MFFRVVVQFFRLFRYVTRGINVTEMEERHDEEIARTLNLKMIFIKLPNQQQKNKMTVSQDTTFGHLKELLSTEHNVEVGRITLVCAGRIMKDEDSVTSQSSLDGMTIHMVVRDLKAKESTMSTNITNVESVDSRPDLALIEQTVTNSPLLRRPEFLQSALLNDPRIQKLMDSHPSLRHLLSDRRVITNLVRNISNPSVMQEIIRANDRTLNNIESLTGGHAELERVFREFDQSISDLTTQASETASSNAEDVGENPQQGAENREPLPNPWAEVQQTQEGCDLSGVFGRMIGETFTQLVQAQHAYDAEGTTPEATENLQRFIELSQEFSRTLQTNSDVTPEQTYHTQLQHLETMGFSDRNANIAALVAASGDINIAVEKLLEPQGQQD